MTSLLTIPCLEIQAAIENLLVRATNSPSLHDEKHGNWDVYVQQVKTTNLDRTGTVTYPAIGFQVVVSSGLGDNIPTTFVYNVWDIEDNWQGIVEVLNSKHSVFGVPRIRW